ncbi:hypothetical protein ETB97_004358 [Aspergillus alliaceus]|uniref:Uncharacterized protein n=1 Tax=Petromyces alliaceus TaxID=209559 RepID=A0A5N7C9R7_PETAA|nr:uncharacterized protein BDW43DRAFT_307990 [Aspergillus alliaceus]KAB8236976.1 hypothetical protein BDW43DRAFT_307990 [Aspergillus alliaceus]KAE8390874.1 hypothetical protein BDV23DRAFT_154076 [Aspergillus alliaceus]KAF5858473.1 hypothetical protein ETB97_004358 [Aspergillus burnettii]
MYFHWYTLLPLLLSLPTALATAQDTASTLDTLKPRNWDLRLLKPGCKPNNSNIDISVYHSSGVSERACDDLTAVNSLNLSIVDTVSWKSPSEPSFDLCMYKTGDCDSEGFMGQIRGGWAVCVKYEGWKGWRAVPKGEECD